MAENTTGKDNVVSELKKTNTHLSELIKETRKSQAVLNTLVSESKKTNNKYIQNAKNAPTDKIKNAYIDAIKQLPLPKGTLKKDGGFSKNSTYGKALLKYFDESDNLKANLSKWAAIIDAYNKDNPKGKITSVTEVPEFTKALASELSIVLKGALTEKDINKSLLAEKSERKSTADYKYANVDGKDVILNFSSDLSRARNEIARLADTTAENVSKIDSSMKKFTDIVEKLSDNSKELRNIVRRTGNTMESTEKKVSSFTQSVIDAQTEVRKYSTNLSDVNKKIGSSTKKISVFSDVVEKASKNAAARGRQGSASVNTFQEQARRNSDRAKAAGFIALLIPALAKLLKKTPVTDYLKLLALRLGSGPSGMGDHPVMGALGVLGAPLLIPAIMGMITKKGIWGKIGTGVGESAKLMNPNTGYSPLLKEMLQLNNPLRGVTDTTRRAHLGFLYKTGQKLYITPSNFPTLAPTRMRTYSAYSAAQRAGILDVAATDANFRAKSRAGGNPTFRDLVARPGHERDLVTLRKGMVNARAQRMFKNMSFAKKMGFMAKGAKGIPLMGTLLSVGAEIPDIINAAKSGKKGALTGQLTKSAGGVTGGIVGSIAGGALGAIGGPAGIAIGSAIGGLLGDVIGRTVAPAFSKGLGFFTKNLGKDFKGMMAGLSQLGSGLMKILTPIGKWIGLLLIPPIKLLGIILGGTAKAVMWAINVLSRTLGGIADFLGGIFQKVEDAFDAFGNWLMQWPLMQWLLEKAGYGDNGGSSGNTPTTNPAETQQQIDKINKQLGSNRYKAGTKEYNKGFEKYRQDFVSLRLQQGDKRTREQLYNSEEAQKYANLSMANEIKQLRYKKASLEGAIGGVFDTTIADSALAGSLYNASAQTFAGHKITSGYGWRVHPNGTGSGKDGQKHFHKGVDLAYGHNDPVAAFMGGTVTFVGDRKDGYGKTVEIRDLFGATHMYHHANAYNVKAGQKVNAGDIIMRAGRTGYATGDHVDYGVRSAKGTNINPITYTASASRFQTIDNTSLKVPENGVLTGGVSMSDVKETASSEIRQTLAQLAGIAQNNSKQARTKSVIFSATDVTGSLGVWGITQMNNGVVNIGK